MDIKIYMVKIKYFSIYDGLCEFEHKPLFFGILFIGNKYYFMK